MRIVHVVRDLDIASGGPSRSVPALAGSLASLPAVSEVSLVFQDRGVATTVDAQATTVDALATMQVALCPVKQPRIGITHLRQRIAGLHRQSPIDVIHLHGIWSPTLHEVTKYALRQGIPYVVAPRGMLSQWCFGSKSLRKRVAWSLYQRGALRNASRIHVTSRAEADDVAKLGISVPVSVIPNGCELPPLNLNQSDSRRRFLLSAEHQWAVSIGRIHPVKRFSELIDAWNLVRPSGWKLMIAGPDEVGFAAELKQQIQRLGLSESIVIRDAVSAQEKWQLLRDASLFVLASHSENFGMVIAEALASAVPVIATHGTPWAELQTERCGWWVAPSLDELAAGLRDAINTTPSERKAMGQRGRELIAQNYAWESQAIKTIEMYQRIMQAS